MSKFKLPKGKEHSRFSTIVDTLSKLLALAIQVVTLIAALLALTRGKL
jgi:hypothetical protein